MITCKEDSGFEDEWLSVKAKSTFTQEIVIG
jgi:hypothetical protein